MVPAPTYKVYGDVLMGIPVVKNVRGENILQTYQFWIDDFVEYEDETPFIRVVPSSRNITIHGEITGDLQCLIVKKHPSGRLQYSGHANSFKINDLAEE